MVQLYLAPMEGVTTDAYRRAYHKNFRSFDKYFTPFIVPYEKDGFAIKELREIDPERNKGMQVIPQILSNHAEGFLHTASQLETFGYHEVNLNLGCPSKTVASKGRGSGFLGFPEELDHFLYNIYEKAHVNISIKTRIGKEQADEFERLLSIYEKYPVSELIIHPRVMKDYYKNSVNLDAYAYATHNSEKSLCYNGDIKTKEHYENIIGRFPGTEKVMIGRGIVHNPFLLEEISGEKAGEGLNHEEKMRLLNFHYDLVDNYRPMCKTEKNLLFKIKEIWMYMSVLFKDEMDDVIRIRRAQDMDEFNKMVELILS